MVLEDYDFDEPNNGIWDAEETADIITTIENGGINATNVRGILSTTDTGVTVSTDTYNFGSMPEGQTANNSSNPYKATAKSSATEHPVEFNLHITADDGYSKDISFMIPIGVARFDYVNVPANNATLTVTGNSAIGFVEPDSNGSGFVYPAGGNNTLYYASMAFGNSSSYLVDNWYVSGGPDRDWRVTTSPNGRIHWVSPPTMGDTMNIAYYDDSGISGAKNVVCRQDAWAFRNNPNYDDFVILRFTYTNNGSSSLTGLYSAIFADFDVSAGGTADDADINESKYLAWVSAGSVYAGITLLDPIDKLANASTIKNETYIYPNEGMTDADQYKFMKKTHHSGSQANGDYGAMVSAGPFDLAPGGSQAVVFAMVGGGSKTDIEERVDAARTTYGVKENVKVIPGDVTLNVLQNPMLNTTAITFSLPKASKVTIDIYDITGRLCHNIVQGQFKAGPHTLKWNIKDELPAGVFFVRLKACDCSGRPICLPLVKKVISLK